MAESWSRAVLSRFKAINEATNDRAFARAAYLRYYRDLVHREVESATTILHFGAGSGGASIEWRLFLNRRFIAIDRDGDRLRANASALKLVADGEQLPLASNSVDIVATEHTFEHLERPMTVLRELHRVLRPGGRIVFAIPNRRSYVSCVARLTPFRLHRWYQALMSGRDQDRIDTTRTFYRLNTTSALRTAAAAGGFTLDAVKSFAGDPSYTLLLPPPIHSAAVAAHKALDRVELLSPFRVNIVGCLVKPQSV